MVRVLTTPGNTELSVRIPEDMVGKTVQVIVALAEETIPEVVPERPGPSAEEAFKAFRVLLGEDYKFDRDETALC